MSDEPWYGVKCIFRHDDLQKKEGHRVYEERVVLVRAERVYSLMRTSTLDADDFITRYFDDGTRHSAT